MSAGIYLRVIRERRDLSRAEIAKKLRTSVQTIANIENGDKEPRGSLLFAFIDAIGASLDDVRRLILEHEDESEAIRLAAARLSQNHIAEIDGAIDRMGQEEARQLADKLMSDPAFFADFLREVAERGRRRP